MGYIIGALISLAVLITVHEFGHFIVARWVGIKIEKFSLGFGPKLFSFKWDEVIFMVSLIPLGGYVKMKGENPDENDEEGNINNDEDSFINKKWWQRALVAFAGPFANFILALIIFIVSYSIGRNYEDQKPIIGQIDPAYESIFHMGDKVLSVNNQTIEGWSEIIEHTENMKSNDYIIERNGEEIQINLDDIEQSFWADQVLPEVDAIIGEVTPGMAAYKAGLMTGDKILAVDDIYVDDWYSMREKIINNQDDLISLLIERDGKKFVKEIKLELNILSGEKIIGVSQYMPVKIEKHYSLLESVKLGSITTMSSIALNYYALYKIFTNPSSISQNIGGPVMIVTMSKQTVNKSLDIALMMIASISIVLMVMNLLPIPILDGGHIFFCFIEGIIRKPLSINVQRILQNIGLILLLSLTVFAFMNDFDKLFKRSSSMHQNSIEMENQ